MLSKEPEANDNQRLQAEADRRQEVTTFTIGKGSDGSGAAAEEEKKQEAAAKSAEKSNPGAASATVSKTASVQKQSAIVHATSPKQPEQRRTRQNSAIKPQAQVAPKLLAGQPGKKRSSSAVVLSSFKEPPKKNSTTALPKGGLSNSQYIQKPAAKPSKTQKKAQ